MVISLSLRSSATRAELRFEEAAEPLRLAFRLGRIGRTIDEAMDRAKADGRLLVLGLHGGRAANGELQAMCEIRGVPFTGSGSASSHLAFDKIAAKRFAAIGGVKCAAGISLDDMESALAEHGKLIAKPVRDGSSYGLIFVNSRQDLVAVRNAASKEEYVIEPFIAGAIASATCSKAERSAEPSSRGGVPTQMKTTSAKRVASSMSVVKERRPSTTLVFTITSRPGS